jgi:hypothetical protein
MPGRRRSGASLTRTILLSSTGRRPRICAPLICFLRSTPEISKARCSRVLRQRPWADLRAGSHRASLGVRDCRGTSHPDAVASVLCSLGTRPSLPKRFSGQRNRENPPERRGTKAASGCRGTFLAIKAPTRCLLAGGSRGGEKDRRSLSRSPVHDFAIADALTTQVTQASLKKGTEFGFINGRIDRFSTTSNS